ncbi:MAG: NAD(P)-dependent alcohol dehydrogenase [Xanthomonadales bacterium]|nr:NAD(P)-dependent alcohol dehydrogenase [Xanthomonadales bacterium]
MKAYAYVNRISLDDLRSIEIPDPKPGPYDVVLRMQAAALNYRDLAIARGQYHINVDPPLVPLSDGAGEVVAVGDQVTRLRVGELACPTYLPDWIDGPCNPAAIRRRLGGPNNGVLLELFCAHEEAVVRAPTHLEPAEAATLPVTAVTAWHSLYRLGNLRPSQTVVVLGSGGVSTTAVQIAKAGGARVISVTRSASKANQLREIGAHYVVTCGDSDEWPRQVEEITGGDGADVVVDVVGAGSLSRSIRALRMPGCVHLVGYAAGTSASFDIFDAIRHGVTIHVATAGNRSDFEALVRVFEQHRIKPAVHKAFPVSEIHRAFEELATGGQFGKVVLTF